MPRKQAKGKKQHAKKHPMTTRSRQKQEADKVLQKARRNKDPFDKLLRQEHGRTKLNMDQKAQIAGQVQKERAARQKKVRIEPDEAASVSAFLTRYIGGAVRGGGLGNHAIFPGQLPDTLERTITVKDKEETWTDDKNALDWTLEKAMSMCSKVVDCLAHSHYGAFRKDVYELVKAELANNIYSIKSNVLGAKIELGATTVAYCEDKIAEHAESKLHKEILDILSLIKYHIGRFSEARRNPRKNVLGATFRYYEKVGRTVTRSMTKGEDGKFAYDKQWKLLEKHNDFQDKVKTICNKDFNKSLLDDKVWREKLEDAIGRQAMAVHWCEIQNLVMKLMSILHWAVHGNHKLDWIIDQYRICMLNAIGPINLVWTSTMDQTFYQIEAFYERVKGDLTMHKQNLAAHLKDLQNTLVGHKGEQLTLSKALTDKKYASHDVQKYVTAVIREHLMPSAVLKQLASGSDTAKLIPRITYTVLNEKKSEFVRLVDALYNELVMEKLWTDREYTWRELLGGHKSLQSKENTVKAKTAPEYLEQMVLGGFIALPLTIGAKPVFMKPPANAEKLKAVGTEKLLMKFLKGLTTEFAETKNKDKIEAAVAGNVNRELWQREVKQLFGPVEAEVVEELATDPTGPTVPVAGPAPSTATTTQGAGGAGPGTGTGRASKVVATGTQGQGTEQGAASQPGWDNAMRDAGENAGGEGDPEPMDGDPEVDAQGNTL